MTQSTKTSGADAVQHRVAANEQNVLVIGTGTVIQVLDCEGQPVAHEPYEIYIERVLWEGKTDSLGWTSEFRVKEGQSGLLSVAKEVYEIEFEDEPADDDVHCQSMLNALGYDAGPLDGDAGRRTQDAACSFQRDQRLEPSGEFDGPTLGALNDMHRVA